MVRPIEAWGHLMSQTVQVEQPTGKTDFGGELTYGAATSYACRLVRRRQVVRRMDGVEVVSMRQLHLATRDAIDPLSRVTLTGDDVLGGETHDATPRILAVTRYPDQHGHHHTVVFL